MKAKDLPASVREACRLTVGEPVGHTHTRPTWDGRSLAIHRLEKPSHVVHEIAHWIICPSVARHCPNYGVGTDPDDGPATVEAIGFYLAAIPAFAVEMKLARGLDAKAKACARFFDREEALAAFVTIRLLVLLGLPWEGEFTRTFGRHTRAGWDPDYAADIVEDLELRGVDVQDPLRPHRVGR